MKQFLLKSGIIFVMVLLLVMISGPLLQNGDRYYYQQYEFIPNTTFTEVLPTNLITNGDFSVDSNADGLADGYTLQYADTPSILNNVQTIQSDGTNARVRLITPNLVVVSTSVYYVSQTTVVPSGYYSRLAPNFTSGSTDVLNGGFSSGLYTSAYSGNINMYLGSVKDPSCLTAQNDGDITSVSNPICFNITSLKTAGLFGGMSDADIKTVLDDYAQNGLTASNIGYFYTSSLPLWDSYTIQEKCAVLSAYGIKGE